MGNGGILDVWVACVHRSLEAVEAVITKSESYPYLALANRLMVPYGTVLSYADVLQKTFEGNITDLSYWETQASVELSTFQQMAVSRVWQQEHKRREVVRVNLPSRN